MSQNNITLGRGSLLINGGPVGIINGDAEIASRTSRPSAAKLIRDRRLLDEVEDGPQLLTIPKPIRRLSIHPLAWRIPFCILAGAVLAYADLYRWSIPLAYVLGGLCTLLLGYGGSKTVIGTDSDPWEDIYS